MNPLRGCAILTTFDLGGGIKVPPPLGKVIWKSAETEAVIATRPTASEVVRYMVIESGMFELYLLDKDSFRLSLKKICAVVEKKKKKELEARDTERKKETVGLCSV